MADPTGVNAVSRRTVLKGMAGAAGLVSIPAIIAACSTPGASTAPSAAAPSAEAPSAAARAAAAPSAATGSVTFGSNYSNKDTDTKAMQAVVDAFTAKTGIAVKVNTVDHNTFQDQISPYLQGTPDDVFTWFAGYRMRFFADQGLRHRHQRPVGQDRRQLQRGVQGLVDGQRRQAVLRAVLQLPVGRHLPQERLRREGLHRPQDVGRVQDPGHEDADRRPHPARLRATRTAGRRWARSTS